MIHVCSLARLHDTVRETGARHVVTLIKDVSLVHRPASITAREPSAARHGRHHRPHRRLRGAGRGACRRPAALRARLGPRARRWWCTAMRGSAARPRARSSTACALNPQRDEAKIARALRDASPTAMPNIRIVSLADACSGATAAWSRRSESIGPGIASLCERAVPARSRVTPKTGHGRHRPHADRNRADRRDRRGGGRRAGDPGGGRRRERRGRAPACRSARSIRWRTAPSRSGCARGSRRRPACASAMSSSSTRSATAAATSRRPTPARTSSRSAISRSPAFRKARPR